jgi:hypothetical protein
MLTLPLIFSPLTTCPEVESVRPPDDLRLVPAGTPVFVASGKEVKLVLPYQFHMNWQFPAQTTVRRNLADVPEKKSATPDRLTGRSRRDWLHEAFFGRHEGLPEVISRNTAILRYRE